MVTKTRLTKKEKIGDLAIQLYRDGVKIAEIKNVTGLDNKAFYQVLKEKGVQLDKDRKRKNARGSKLDAVVPGTIADLYLKQRWPTRKIAKHYGVDRATLMKFFSKHHIPVRKERLQLDVRQKLQDINYMTEQYCVLREPARVIGAQLGVSGLTVSRSLKRLGIQLRRTPGNTLAAILKEVPDLAERLRDMHWHQRKTLTEIAKMYNVSIATISLWMDKFEIPVNREIATSSYEAELEEFVKTVDPDAECVRNDRKTLATGEELDVYLPGYKVGVEFHGLYWHRNQKWKHFRKAVLGLEQGIRLFQVFEDEWTTKKRGLEVVNIARP